MRWFALLLLVPLPAHAQCQLTGSLAQTQVRVQPRGGPAFSVDLVDHPAVARFSTTGRARVVSRGALRFTASAEPRRVAIALAGPTRIGPILLRPGTPVLEHETRPGAMFVTLRLVDGEVPGVTLSATLPCRSLGLGATAEPPSEPPAGVVERGTLLSARRRLSVHAFAASPGSIRLDIHGEPLRFAELGRRDGWVHIRRDFFSGSTLDGWVREDHVRVVDDAEIRGVLMGTGAGTAGMCGHGSSHHYTGPATLRRRALVSERREGAAWATARADTPVFVDFAWGDDWVQLERLPGMRSREACTNILTHAWVRRSDVIVPGHEARE